MVGSIDTNESLNILAVLNFFGYYPTRQVPTTYFLYIFLKSIFEEVCTKKSFYS